MGAVKRVKNVEWEKNRRDRLNLTFIELSKLLPDHDPAVVMSKVDILQKSIAYIKELHDKNCRLVDRGCCVALKSEIESTKQMLSELKERNQQLLKLLHAAENSAKRFTPLRKWEGKLSQSATNRPCSCSDLPQTKEIKLNEKPVLSSLSLATPAKVKKKAKKRAKSAGKRLLQINQKKNQQKSTPLREINNGGVETIKNTIVPTEEKGAMASTHKDTSSSVSTTVSTVLSQPRTNIVTVAKSSVLSTPIMATGIQPVLHRNPALSALGPGTLIMPDGRVVSVPAPPTVLATATQIIVNRPTNQPAVILMQNLAPVKTVPSNQPRPIVPKPRRRDTTNTTYVNKVPIPAIRTHTFSGSTTSSKTVTAKDNKKSNVKQNIVSKKENIKSKLVSKGTDKNKHVVVKDKSVIDQLLKDNTTVAANKSRPNQKVCNEEKMSSSNQEPILNCHKPLEKNKKTELNSNTAKRKAIIEEGIEISKRVKVTETIDEEKQNSGKTLPSNTLECNNSDNSENVQESQKEPPTLENSETNSLNTLGRQENVNDSNLESAVNIPQLIEQTSEITASLLNDIPLQENACLPENQNDSLNKNDGKVKESTIQTKMPSTEKDTTENQAAKEQTCNINIENVEEKQQKVNNIEGSTKNQQESTSSTIITGNTNQIAAVQFNCPGNTEHSAKNAPVETLQKNSLHSEGNKKTIDSIEKGNQENKLIIQDDSQELTSLFPSDPKLQSCPDNIFRDADFRDRNLFMPISHSYMDDVRLSLPHSDFSNDLFSSLQVPTGGQHPESISPTAAFLLAFPLVSTSKTSELIAETDANESQHATPTTILQIGNIDPPGSDSYHHTLMIEGNVAGLQDPAKMAKPDETVKNSTMPKQLKDVNNFGKLHHMEMNELLRSESFTRNNNCGKEKKHFSDLQDQDIFLPCNKKKANGKQCEYPVSSEMVPQFHDKTYEFTSSTLRHSSVQTQARHLTSNNEKKIVNSENLINPHNSYNPSSQPYLYNTNVFQNGNDFSLSNSNYPSNNRSLNESSKSSQIPANLNVTAWSASSISATTNRIEYSTTYCTNTQKPFTNQAHKNISQKVHQTTYEEQIMKDKSTLNNNSLPKFSANFQFNNNTNINNSHPSQDIHNYPQGSQMDNINFKLDSKSKKSKSNSQRAPVNWMTTPDVRPTLPDPNLTSALPDATFQPQKEPDFNSTGNNVMLSTSNNITSFNISSVSNNPQSFYSNTHFPGLEFQLDYAPFPEITSTSKAIRTMSSSQQNPHHYSWSPSKSSMPLLPHLDSHMIPSTLPTLVGDLALGTSTPSGPVDTFRTLGMPTTPFSMDGMGKKVDVKHDTQKQGSGKSPDKDSFANSERRNNNRNVPEYCQKSHSHQSTNTTSSFLSVSQLVDQVKSEQGSSRRSGKQTVANKNNTNVPKRNSTNHQPDKTNLAKISNNLNNSNSFQPSIHPSSVNHRKHDMHSGYQDNQGTSAGFPGGFGTQVNAPPWQQGKIQRSSIHYKGNYSAESLIGDHSVATAHDHIAELPPFSVANQFPNQYNHTPVGSTASASYSGHSLPHQNLQPLEFHQNSHQNSFNFSSQNSHYSAPFNTDNDFHLGLDPLYSFNSSTSRNTSCQTSAPGIGKDNRNSHKRTQSSKRREDYPQTHFMQTAQGYPRGKSSLPSTSSPGHPGTTSLTNFNLSTIFPEINDKRVVPGANTFLASGNKHSDNSGPRPNTRPDYLGSNFNPNNVPQMQQVGLTPAPPHFPTVSFANISGPAASAPNNFRPQ